MIRVTKLRGKCWPDLIAIFGGLSHQFPVEQHVAGHVVDVPAAFEALELDLYQCSSRDVEAHGQLETVAAERCCQVAETGSVECSQFWWSSLLFLFLFLLVVFICAQHSCSHCSLDEFQARQKVTDDCVSIVRRFDRQKVR